MFRHLTILLFIVLAVCLSAKIDINTADAGRHIKNGEVFVTGTTADRSALLHTNFYSYTQGEQPFVNHHWGTGVIFYLVYTAVGFTGLSLFYILLFLLAFWFFFDIARREGGIILALALSLLALSVIASRTEVRPEVFTYLFSGLYFWILWRHMRGEIGSRWLIVLPLVQIIWVNVHIAFIFGPFIVGAFFVGEILNKNWERVKKLFIIGTCVGLASLINPSGLAGALYPLAIFNSYSYRVLENQSVPFLENLHVGNGVNFFTYKVLLVLAVISLLLLVYAYYQFSAIPLIILSTVFGYLGWTSIRQFPAFGFISVVAIATSLKYISLTSRPVLAVIKNKDLQIVFLSLIFMIGVVVTGLSLHDSGPKFGLGVNDNASAAADFFKENKLHGPIFNNYDIGGYIIYYLYPDEKVFFDNRPEAYSQSFVTNKYISALEDPSVFEKIDEEYTFNAIFFYYRDYTPWGQEFITKKVFDKDWAPVYADSYNIILLRRNEENSATIKRFEISRDSFKISK